MVDKIEKSPSLSLGDLREVTLRIPGEHFFCESFDLPSNLISQIRKGDDEKSTVPVVQRFVEGLLDEPVFSPYPAEQLAWGYHYCTKSYKVLIFATPMSKLHQLGWENLELFRRIFPSFVSLLATHYEEPTLVFFICDETLTAATFPSHSSTPDEIFSLPIELNCEESFESARGRLLSLVDLSKYKLLPDILIARNIFRNPDGYFEFEHDWKSGEEVHIQFDRNVRMEADLLWNHDLRSPVFKEQEKTKRLKERSLWRALKASAVFLILLFAFFVTLEIFDFKHRGLSRLAAEMAEEVPLVLESQKLLEKLKQNKLGGIDPFGAIGRLSVHRGGKVDRPSLWFSKAHFETRNHVKLEGEGINVESVNTFLSNIEGAGVAQLRKGRGGDEIREIKSEGGKTTFEIEINLIEEVEGASSSEGGGAKP
jgi:hypothetical protein